MHDWKFTEYVAYRAKVEAADADRLLRQLEDAGFVGRSTRNYDGRTEDVWNTTLLGSALAGASFLKPITRAKAEALLAGVLDRTRQYNADSGKPMWIDKVSLFGSVLDEGATDFGDVDIHVVLADRAKINVAEAALAYARASGRTFSSFIDELEWSRREAIRTLKNRSGYISIHTEDLSDVTDRLRVVYERKRDD